MATRLRLAASVFQELEEVLRRAEPREGGLFLLVGHVETARGLILTARRVLAPPADAWRLQRRDQLAPSTAWLSEVLGEADEAGLGLAFVHSHPGPMGFTEFSGADEWMHEQLVPVMVSNLDGRVFSSFVYASGRMEGAAWWNGRRSHVDRITVVGRALREVGRPRGEPGPSLNSEWDRQVRVWGAEGQRTLAELSVGVAGAGGTGSAFAEQLVRLGVGHVVVVDHDVLGPTNVSRVYASRPDQVGLPKVEISRAHLDGIRGGAVEAVNARVEEPEAIGALVACDLLVGCTDAHAARAFLNDVAMQYLVPLIDVGCRVVPKGAAGTFVPVEVRHVHPDGPCLWCMGDVLDGRRIREEGLAPHERAGLLREGYVSGLTSEPSVIPVTTAVATLGVLRLLGVVLGVVDYPGTRVVGDLRDLEFMFVEDAVSPTCVCAGRKGYASLRSLP